MSWSVTFTPGVKWQQQPGRDFASHIAMKPGAHTDERGNKRPSRATAAGVRRSANNLAEKLNISRQAIRASEDLLRELTEEQVTYVGIGSPTPEPSDAEPPADGSPSTSA